METPLYCYVQASTGICQSIGVRYGQQQQTLMPLVIREFRDFYGLDGDALAPLYHRYVQATLAGLDNIRRSKVSRAEKSGLTRKLYGEKMTELLDWFKKERIYSPYYLLLRLRLTGTAVRVFRSQNEDGHQWLYGKAYWAQYYLLRMTAPWRRV